MDKRTKKIFESIEKHKQEVLKHVENEKQILGIFLYGSQNYMLDTEESDVDTVAIILPTERELYFEKPITKEIHLDNGEHIVMKDIREYIRMLKKQNLG
jgi:predicted nucleotidyltransferase